MSLKDQKHSEMLIDLFKTTNSSSSKHHTQPRTSWETPIKSRSTRKISRQLMLQWIWESLELRTIHLWFQSVKHYKTSKMETLEWWINPLIFHQKDTISIKYLIFKLNQTIWIYLIHRFTKGLIISFNKLNIKIICSESILNVSQKLEKTSL